MVFNKDQEQLSQKRRNESELMKIGISKGQFTLIALIATILTFLAFAKMFDSELFSMSVDRVEAVNGSPPEINALVRLMPFFIVLAIALTAVITVLPVSGH